MNRDHIPHLPPPYLIINCTVSVDVKRHRIGGRFCFKMGSSVTHFKTLFISQDVHVCVGAGGCVGLEALSKTQLVKPSVLLMKRSMDGTTL